MNLNLKMTVERSKRRSQFLSLVFITKYFNKNLLLRKKSTLQIKKVRCKSKKYVANKKSTLQIKKVRCK